MKKVIITALSMATIAGSAFADSSAITNEAQFRAGMIGPGTLSLMESKIANDKASNDDVMEFSTFETDEQNALGTILKELNTPKPEMNEADKATLAKLKSDAKGVEFDKDYVQDQIDGHEKLLSVVESYLKHSDASSADPKEMEARHLAIFARAAIHQHIANTKKLKAMLK